MIKGHKVGSHERSLCVVLMLLSACKVRAQIEIIINYFYMNNLLEEKHERNKGDTQRRGEERKKSKTDQPPLYHYIHYNNIFMSNKEIPRMHKWLYIFPTQFNY